MAIRIPFGMGIARMRGDKFIQRIGNILANRRVGIFVNGQPCGSMRTENETEAALHLRFFYHCLYAARDIQQLRALGGLNGNTFHAITFSSLSYDTPEAT